MSAWIVGLGLGLGLVGASAASGAAPEAVRDRPVASEYWESGRFAEGEAALSAWLDGRGDDEEARFALGVIRFLAAVERRARGFSQYGYRSGLLSQFFPMTNLPVPASDRVETLDYAKARGLIEEWVSDLRKVDETLAGLGDGEVKLRMRLGLVRMDLNGDGRSEDGESLWRVYQNFNRGARLSLEDARGFEIAFDRADADWLRGYCRLLAGLGEVALAHDFEEPFKLGGPLFFRGVAASQPFLAVRDENGLWEIADLIAFVHAIRLPVREPERLRRALEDFEATAALSRSSWRRILAETDDDREWIPNPKQDSVLPNGRVSEEMVAGWIEFLDEFEAILAGRTLVPMWRGDDPQLGLNVRRVFLEPRPLDLVLWIQGSAAAPYLERGKKVSSPAFWARMNRIFQGEFIGFAIWFN